MVSEIQVWHYLGKITLVQDLQKLNCGQPARVTLYSGELIFARTFLITQLLQNLPAMRETLVQSLGQDDPLEKDNSLQYSCLENSMDREGWWATVHGVAKSWT